MTPIRAVLVIGHADKTLRKAAAERAAFEEVSSYIHNLSAITSPQHNISSALNIISLKVDTKGRTGFAEIPLAHTHHLSILMPTKSQFLTVVFEDRTSATGSEHLLIEKYGS